MVDLENVEVEKVKNRELKRFLGLVEKGDGDRLAMMRVLANAKKYHKHFLDRRNDFFAVI